MGLFKTGRFCRRARLRLYTFLHETALQNNLSGRVPQAQVGNPEVQIARSCLVQVVRITDRQIINIKLVESDGPGSAPGLFSSDIVHLSRLLHLAHEKPKFRLLKVCTPPLTQAHTVQ